MKPPDCRAQVERDNAGRVDPEGGQGVGQLYRPAQRAGMAYLDGGVGSHARARAGRGHAVDQDHAFLDQPGGIVQAAEAAPEQGVQRYGGVSMAAGRAGFSMGSGVDGAGTERSRRIAEAAVAPGLDEHGLCPGCRLRTSAALRPAGTRRSRGLQELRVQPFVRVLEHFTALPSPGSHSAKGRQEAGGVWTVICPGK